MNTNHMFKHRSPNIEKLLAFGFAEENGEYVYATSLLDGQFSLTVTVGADKRLKTELIDAATGEEYTLHLVESAYGSFVGSVRTAYESVLTMICDRCCDKEVFKSDYAHRAIEYVRNTYGDEPEYLWDKFPSNAVWRRRDNRKWYGALLTVSEEKLGFPGKELIEIIDLRIEPDKLERLLDGKRYFPGYHMNKKHWFTICLDGSVPFEEVCRRIDESYLLAKK